MSTSFQAKSEDADAGPRLRLMRDRLDELDELLDKMLALPLPTPEGPPPLRLHEPDASAEPDATKEPGSMTEADSPPPAVQASPDTLPTEHHDKAAALPLAPAQDAPACPGDRADQPPACQEQAGPSAPAPAALRLAAEVDADLAATEARLTSAAPSPPTLPPMTTPSLSRTMMVLEQPLRSPTRLSAPVEDPPPAWWLNLLGWMGLLLLLAAAALTLGRWLAQP